MALYRNRPWRFEPPHTVTFILVIANVFVFGLSMRHSSAAGISPEILFLNGAMYPLAIVKHEYWRLVAYAFLHANIVHLVTNMICLVLWGGYLEKRVGPFYFLAIYFAATIAGGIVSDLLHTRPYLTVGASGAISGILGALLCLWVLHKIDVAANFFVINIGLNVVAAMTAPTIDWMAHLGGFAAGLVVCALIDLLERAGTFVFRCTFPEFVKLNGGILGAMLGIFIWGGKPNAVTFDGAGAWFPPLAFFAACLAAVKLVDLVLSLKKGLAIIVMVFAFANAGLTLLAGAIYHAMVNSTCASQPHETGTAIETAVRMACLNRPATIAIIAACVFALTILLYSQELIRGVNDVGFVGASLRAERQRRRGI
jgi:membrane associated rhomboid family serine protease